jgi:ATP-binding cassette subfamily B (MDR/TAP) protein 1
MKVAPQETATPPEGEVKDCSREQGEGPPPEVGVLAGAGMDEQSATTGAGEGGQGEEDEDGSPESEVAVNPASMKELFRFAEGADKWFLALGCLAAAVQGVTMPLMIVYWGESIDALNDTTDLVSQTAKQCLMFFIVGCFSLVASCVYCYSFTLVSDRMSQRLKAVYARAILRQETGWFDQHKASEQLTRVQIAGDRLNDGTGRKFGDLIMNITMVIAFLVASFCFNAVLTAILLACVPFIGFVMASMADTLSEGNEAILVHYAAAGAIATETISGASTVAACSSQALEIRRYGRHLDQALAAGIKMGSKKGSGMGSIFACVYLFYVVAFVFAAHQIARCTEGSSCSTSAGDVMIAVFSIIVASVQLGNLAPGATALAAARVAMRGALDVVDLVPKIDAYAEGGTRMDSVRGELSFSDLSFCYPTRPDEQVLTRMNLTVAPGESIGVCGPSGGGKSTIIKLLLRFYDPASGSVNLDGIPLTDLNLSWYRQSVVGYVGQEPVLFADSIRENIRHGKPGATDAEVEEACKMANAHEFISAFPKGYNTPCGDGGAQLSGGQKQRIAIARAIIKNPQILLLDEATSALDSESERIVQEALDRVKSSRTTVVVAHRLSTLSECDHLVVVGNGGVMEYGTHAELLAAKGAYAQLCSMQQGEEESPSEEQGVGAAIRRKSSIAEDHEMAKGFSHSLPAVSSASDVANKGQGKNENQAKADPGAMKRLWEMSRPEMRYLSIGFVGSLITGALFPLEGLLLALNLNIYYNPDPSYIRTEGTKVALLFVAMAGGAQLGYFMMAYGFSVSGEHLTKRLRESCYSSILRQPPAWLDLHNTGDLTTALEQDAFLVAQATGVAASDKVRLVLTLGIAIVIAFAYSWQVSLLSLATVPFMALGAHLQMKLQWLGGGKAGEEVTGTASAAAVLGSAMDGISTVQALNRQATIAQQHEDAVMSSLEARKAYSVLAALAFGYSNAIFMWVFALLFYVGALLIEKGSVDFLGFYTALMVIVQGSAGIGQVSAGAVDSKKGLLAASRIFAIIDAPHRCDPLAMEGAKPVQVEGATRFRKVNFAYPARPDDEIYHDFDLKVPAGKTVALVGPSGSGKSTCVALLLRFYEPASGSIELDARDIEDLNLRWLRGHIGYVGQEPLLFRGTIRENIERGLGGGLEATDEQIVAAAKLAFAHDFITTQFQSGYDTEIGEKQSLLLSGGQKQRIAIARAIIKDPEILLLDEATAALDSDSQARVQEALDNVKGKRTTIVIAHRLTTIQSADQIAVVADGKIAELGKHSELMARNESIYKSLYLRQTEKLK